MARARPRRRAAASAARERARRWGPGAGNGALGARDRRAPRCARPRDLRRDCDRQGSQAVLATGDDDSARRRHDRQEARAGAKARRRRRRIGARLTVRAAGHFAPSARAAAAVSGSTLVIAGGSGDRVLAGPLRRASARARNAPGSRGVGFGLHARRDRSTSSGASRARRRTTEVTRIDISTGKGGRRPAPSRSRWRRPAPSSAEAR